MKGHKHLIAMAMSSAVIAGCATPISMAQKNELRGYEAKGLAVEEKNPSVAAGLGILPGFGSFYTRNYGPGIVNLLLWPLSALWDPMSGYDGAVSINYYATKTAVQAAMTRDMTALDRELEDGTVSRDQYIRRKREIEARYSSDIVIAAAPLLSAGAPVPAASAPAVAAAPVVAVAPAPAPVQAPVQQAPVQTPAPVPATKAAAPVSAAAGLNAGNARAAQSTVVRARPQAQATIAQAVPAGAPLQLLVRQVNGEGAWWFAEFQGTSGWVSENGLIQ